MTDVLLLADLHGNYGKLDAFLSYDYDAVIIAGDITNFGPLEPVDSVLSNFEVPCFAIPPGNCDPPREIIDVLERSDAVCLHNSWIALGKITLAGLGGSNKTPPFDTPFELTEEEIDKDLTRITNHMDKNIHNVLLCHAPPYEALDTVEDNHVAARASASTWPGSIWSAVLTFTRHGASPRSTASRSSTPAPLQKATVLSSVSGRSPKISISTLLLFR